MEKKEKISKKIINLLFLVGIFSFAFFTLHLSEANAASLYFSPSSGSYSVGQTVTVGVYVNSSDKAMNAASGIVSFPTDKLQVVSISKSGSIVNLWVQEPSFSNSVGTINFEGVVLNPGFTGQTGKIIDINFRTKTAGTGPLSFSSSFVLANDGLGTDILTNSGSASFSIKTSASASSVETSSATPSSAVGGPSSPEVTSETHPDSNKWYNNPDPIFEWSVPSDVTALQTLAGSHPDSVPTILYRSLISKKEVEDMPDGIWYFHIRFKNDEGWSKTTHFRFQIDTEKPNSFSIKEVKRDDATNPKVSFEFNAKDETSGIDHYEIVIDDKETIIWKDDGMHIYTTPSLNPGEHNIVINAVDAAGNTKEDSTKFSIDPLWPPKITEYPSKLQKGDTLIVKGSTAYSDAQVTLFIQKKGDDETKLYSIVLNKAKACSEEIEKAKICGVTTSDIGEFIFTDESGLPYGVYTLWAEVTDDRDAKSDISEKVSFVVERSNFALGSTQLISILILITLLVIAWYAYNIFILIKRKLKKEVNEAQRALHKAFNLLHKEMQEHIVVLEKTKQKRLLTKEEEATIKRFKKNLQDAEKFIKKEIDDIEKELK